MHLIDLTIVHTDDGGVLALGVVGVPVEVTL